MLSNHKETLPPPFAPDMHNGSGSMTSGSQAAQQRALKILLIEDDPIDATWITELIHKKGPGTEVVRSAAAGGPLSEC